MKIQIMSDVENAFDSFPAFKDAELILIAGDITRSGLANEYYSAANWIKLLSKSAQVFYIGGNRDENIEKLEKKLLGSLAIRLNEEPLIFQEISFVGLNQVYYGDFPYKASTNLMASGSLAEDHEYYDGLPSANVIVSHSPAFGVLDNGEGSPALRTYLSSTNPNLVVCGHSDSPGEVPLGATPFPKTRYINCCKQNKLIEFAL